MTVHREPRLSRRTVVKAGATALAVPFVGNGTWSSVSRARAQDSVTLQATVWLGDFEFQKMEELAAVYTANHPEVTIEYINIVDGGPWGRDQLQRMIAGGTPPDLMMMNTGQFESFGARGALAELDERATAAGFDLNVYFPAALDGCRIDGKLYGLPKDISNVVMYLNTDFFAEAGVEVPSNEWTWADYREICKALTRDSDGDGSIDRWGISLANATWAWGSFVHSNGGLVMNEERTECLLNSDEAKAGLRAYFGVIAEDQAAVPPGALPQMEGSNYFLGGITGMEMAGPWYRPALVEDASFNWTVRLFPRPAADPALSVLYTDQWAMSSASENPDAAWDFLKFLGGTDGHTAWSEIYGSRSIVPVQALAQSDGWLNYGGEAHRADNELILSQLDRTFAPATNFADGTAIENIWDAQFDLVIVGQQDIDVAVDAITEMVNAELS